MENIWNNFLDAVRSLMKSRFYALTVILLLGMGIGAGSSMFSIVSKYRFRPLPVKDGGNLVQLAARRPARDPLTNLSYPNFKDIRDANVAFDGLIAYTPIQPRIKSDAYSGINWGQAVTGDYFEMLGVTPILGRALTRSDDEPEAESVVLLSQYLWKDSFTSDAAIVGKRIYLNGYPFIVCGVMSEGFRGTDSLLRADLWVAAAKSRNAGGARLDERDGNDWRALGHLRPGTTLNQAQANLDGLTARLREQFPAENRGIRTLALWEKQARPEVSQGNQAAILWVLLMGMAAAVLTIAGSNVAGLMLARGVARQREISVRLALGATRARLITQLLFESLLLSLGGAALGLFATSRIMNFFSQVETPSNTPIYFDYRPDNIVLVFTILLAVFTAVIVGIAPAFTTTRSNLQDWLKDGYGSTARHRFRLQSFVVVSQFTMVALLLALGSLFLQRINEFQKLPTGFESENRLLLTLSTADNGYDAVRGRQLLTDLLARVRSLPQVTTAEAVNDVPLAFGTSSLEIQPVGRTSVTQPVRVSYDVVTDGVLKALNIPLLDGRAFDQRDHAGSASVAIVNEALAERFWPGENPIGKQILNGDRTFEVIGVARNAKYYSWTETRMSFFYLPYSQEYRREMTLVVHTDRDPTLLTVAVRDALRQLDPTLSLFNVLTLSEAIDNMQLGGARIGAGMLGIFGSMGFILATLGLYGLLSYVVRLQTREIGIRMALGATTSGIVRLFLNRGLRLAVAGAVLGLVLALGVAKLIGNFIIGAWTLSLPAIVEVGGLIAAIAFIATYLPARRALADNPLSALRHE